MIPYKDENPTSTTPYLTMAIIAINVLVYLSVNLDPSLARKVVYSFGALPAVLMGADSPQPVSPATTIFTSMFLHGGLFHLGGNMLYLWIFGNNIEDKLGHIKFAVFYFVGGTVAVYAHAVTDPQSMVPMIGASGAIAAVLGAYLLLYPRANVRTIIFLGFFIQIVRLPALIVIGFWAIIQIVNGLVSRGIGGGGVAWFAHVGGFVFGVAVIKLFIMLERRRRSRW